MRLNDKKIAVLVADEYEDLELWYPLLRMKEAGAEVTVIASDNVSGDICKSKHGYEIEIDKKAAEVNPSEYDAAIIPGGWAPDKLRRCQNTLDFIKELNAENKVIASICHGGWVLASASIVEAKTLTSTPAIKDDLENAGANWVDEKVVIDDNLITSRNPDDLPAFTKAIITSLSENVCIECGTEYKEEGEPWYYCVDCNSLYCPECVVKSDEDKFRRKTTDQQQKKTYEEKKHQKKIENSSNVEEYKRLICPNCDNELRPF
ncbi:MAG: type 1 glutamine amidotransferase domain-containing protein [Halanaerobiaceae bacterium]